MLTLLAPGALWLLLTLPVIVLLYVVRERRQQRVVSALFLWTEAKVSARRRRRISPTLLLLLQLLLAALLAFALAQPRLRTSGAPPRILVIDASASMAALGPGGSRLDDAVAQAEALLTGAGEVAVVRAGLGARVVQPLAGDHAQVRRVLRGLVAADSAAATADALTLARSLAPGAEVHLFSDQAKPAGFSDVALHAVGQSAAQNSGSRNAPNLGISAFDLAYGQLFVSVINSTDAPRTAELILSETSGDGVDEVRTSLLVPARGQANTSLPVASDVGRYRAQLAGSPDAGLQDAGPQATGPQAKLPDDALELDNEAFAGSRALRVRLLGDAPALARLLQALPSTVLGAPGGADVTLSVGQSGPLPAGNVIVFAAPEDAPAYAEIADWTRSDPLLRFADLTGAVIAPATAPPPLPLEQADVLARTADLTPVLLRWTQDEREVLYFAFNPAQSDLPRRPAFPIVLTNALTGFRSEARVPLGTALGGGEYLTEPGRLERGGRSYTSAPLPATESRLEVTATSSDPPRPASTADSDATRDPALWLVAGALFLLLTEWLLWSQGRAGGSVRVTGRTSPSAKR